MFRLISLLAIFWSGVVFADAPVIWSGTTAKWLPNGLHSAGICKIDVNGVQTNYTTDGIVKMTSGVPGAAASGTDFQAPLSTSAAVANQFVTGFTSPNTFTRAQPAFTDFPATTGSRAVVTNSFGFLQASPVTSTEVGNLAGTTSSIQVQLNNKFSLPGFTLGSVPFSNGSTLAQDNSNFFWDSTNHRLGIGTATPRGQLDVININDSLFESPTIAGAGGSDNNSWLFYASSTGTFSLWNRNQLLHGFGVNSFGNVLLGAGAAFGNPVATVVVQNGAGATTLPSVTVNAIASQSAPLQDWRASDQTTVLAQVTVAGKGFFTGLDASSNKITNVTDPTSAQDAATKSYVDVLVANDGVAKDASKYATTAALPTVIYSNGSSGVGATLTAVALAGLSIDGASPTVGDRILVKNQVSTFQNGIYTVTATGSAGAVFVLTRAVDYDQAAEALAGASTFILSGTTNSATVWDQNSANVATMGTDAITFAQTAGPGSITAGAGITVTGTSVAITDTAVTPGSYTNASITVNSRGQITAASSGSGGTGSSALSVRTIAADYTLTNSDDIILCNTTTSLNLSLHKASSATTKSYKVKNINSGGCFVNTTGSDLVETTDSVFIAPGGLPMSAFEFIPNGGGAAWYMF